MKRSCTAVVYIAVCSRLAAARGYNICIKCFPFMIDLLRQLRTPFSYFYHRIIQEIYLIVSILNCQSVMHFSYGLFMHYLEIT